MDKSLWTWLKSSTKVDYIATRDASQNWRVWHKSLATDGSKDYF